MILDGCFSLGVHVDEQSTILDHLAQVLRQLNGVTDHLVSVLPAIESRLARLEEDLATVVHGVSGNGPEVSIDGKLDGIQRDLQRAAADRAEHKLEVLRQLLDRNIDVFRQIQNTNLGLSNLLMPPENAWSPMFDADEWRAGKRPETAPVAKVPLQSSVCRQEDFATDWLTYWCVQLDIFPQYGRKWWEFAFICQALWERGLLAPGHSGLGFGVGIERLPALFAQLGCTVVATDAPFDHAEATGWADSSVQYAADGLGSLRYDEICDPDTFFQRVRFRAVDMNEVPSDLANRFDFTWSSCAFEHLGSLDAGARFVERSIECLVPGGVAVHTTEYTLDPLRTVETGPTVLYRALDLAALMDRIRSSGHEVEPLDLDIGNGLLDRYVDLPPYRTEPHLKLALEGFVTTSIGLIIRKGES
ncbi:MAG: hypothetical protein R2823_04070 [Acidimicrobiia bacterium]